MYEIMFFLLLSSVDLKKWKQKIEADMKGEDSLASQVLESSLAEGVDVFKEHEFFKDGILTIGCVGKQNYFVIMTEFVYMFKQ